MSEPSPRHAPLGFRGFVVIVALLMGLNALAIDIMLPALPDMGRAFTLDDPNRAQNVLVLYLAGFGAGQLLVGVLADRFGRKPVLLAGLVGYGLAALACVLAPDFATLLAARFVQGMASAAPRVVSVAIVRDCYSGRRMAQVMSLSMTVFMVVPVLAPAIGQAILLVAPWEAVFIVLALYAAAMFWACTTRLPETLAPEDRRPIRLARIVEALGSILRARQTVGYMLAAGVFLGALFGFVTSAQQVMGEVLGLGRLFPLAFALCALSIALSSLVNAALVERLGMRLLSHGAVLAATIIAALMLALGEGAGLWGYLALQSALMLMVGLTFSNFNALAMEPQGHVAGMASAVTGTVTVLMGAGIGHVIGQAFDGTTAPLGTGYLACGLGTLGILLVTERGRLFSRAA